MWSGPVVVSTALSALALPVALTSLGWQVLSWRRSGPRVSVTARAAVTGGGDGLVALEATNSGRLATVVQNCGFDLRSGRHIVCPFDFLGAKLQLPADLPPGGAVEFLFKASDIWTPLHAEGDAAGEGVRAYVSTGHGRVRGKAFNLGNMLRMLRSAETSE
jgi:hypothetical protein